MRCEQYKGIEEPLVRDQAVLLLKKDARGRSAVEREQGKEGHRKGLWHMVIVKSLWRAPSPPLPIWLFFSPAPSAPLFCVCFVDHVSRTPPPPPPPPPPARGKRWEGVLGRAGSA